MKITDNKALNAVTIVCSSFNKAILFYKILTEIDLIPRLQAKNVTQVSKCLFAALKSISKYVQFHTMRGGAQSDNLKVVVLLECTGMMFCHFFLKVRK